MINSGRRLLLAILFACAVSSSSHAHANLLYRLVDDDGIVYATLELAQLPATHADVVRLRFLSPVGELNPIPSGIYGGDFDVTTTVDGAPGVTPAVVDEGGFLVPMAGTDVLFLDVDGDHSAPNPGLTGAGMSYLSLTFLEDNSGIDDYLFGEQMLVGPNPHKSIPMKISDDIKKKWKIIPEPSTAALLAISTALAFFFRMGTRQGWNVKSRHIP